MIPGGVMLNHDGLDWPALALSDSRATFAAASGRAVTARCSRCRRSTSATGW